MALACCLLRNALVQQLRMQLQCQLRVQPWGWEPGQEAVNCWPLAQQGPPGTCDVTKYKILEVSLFGALAQKHQLELSFCYFVIAPRWNCFKDLNIWGSAMGTWGRAHKETTSGRGAAVEGSGSGVGSVTARVHPGWLWKPRSRHSVCVNFTAWSKLDNFVKLIDTADWWHNSGRVYVLFQGKM